MPKYDPKDEKWDEGGGDRTEYVGECHGVFGGAGIERWKSSNNNDMLSIRFVCLRDLDDGDNEGKHLIVGFPLIDSTMGKLMKMVRAHGWTEPFDPWDDEDISNILSQGPVIADTEVETGSDGNDYAGVGWDDWESYEGELDPDWEEMCNAAFESHESYLTWRSTHPRGAKKNSGGNQRSGGGRSSSSGGGSGGGGGGRQQGGDYDGDIPF